jgi:hypothetical protein
MMYETLYQYFIQHKNLIVPGVGTFLLERKPAVSDFVNRQINPPSYLVIVRTSPESPTIHFFKWLATALHISDHDAIIRFNDFVFETKKQINDGASIDWHGVGTISKGLSGELKFSPVPEIIIEKPVAAEKLIREKAEHMVRVGEDQKTSAEMTEMLNQPMVRKSFWWVTALALGLLALVFIGWYFYEYGIDISSIANTIKVVQAEASEPYQIFH